jgi:sterol desaturase/sphingolipid hydroxylase (fatty acid hydroxylase superfamily)
MHFHFSPTEVITTSILIASVFGFILLERLFPYRKGIKIFREGFWMDLVWYTLIQSYFLKIFIFDYLITPLDHHYHLSRLHLVTGWPLWVQVLFFFVIHDFYIYWFHRAQHHNKILWRIHEAHHSNKEVDWLAGSRSHFLEIIINQTIEFAPIVLLGANPMVVPIKALMDAVYGMFIHSNINVSLGKLKFFFNGPEMHQWHHADNQAVFYMNYSTKLSLWIGCLEPFTFHLTNRKYMACIMIIPMIILCSIFFQLSALTSANWITTNFFDVIIIAARI